MKTESQSDLCKNQRTRADTFNKSFEMKYSYIPQTTSSGTLELLVTTNPQRSHKAFGEVSDIKKIRNVIRVKNIDIRS